MSLLCSRLECLFEGKRELFKGLYIDSTDYSFEKFPALHFDFDTIGTTSYESFLLDFENEIISEVERNGVAIERDMPSSVLLSFLHEVDKKTVIIIDNHDSPLLKTYSDEKKSEEIRSTLDTFYAVIKNRDEKIRFSLLIGVTKYTCLSIFSGFNNLDNITLNKNYATAFDYTEEKFLLIYR